MGSLIPFFRFVHIFSAIYWVGTVLFMAAFLEPTVRAMGPAGGQFMQRLNGSTRFALSLSLAGLLTILAGLALYGPVTSFTPAVMFGDRLPLTIGALSGIASAAVGMFVSGRSSARMSALGKEIAAGGGPPTPAQAAEMGKLQSRLRNGARATAILMVIAVIGMTWP